MAIYRHYANREALLNSVANACFAEIGDRWAQRPRLGDLNERVIELLDDYLDFALGQPRLYDFLSPNGARARHAPRSRSSSVPTCSITLLSYGPRRSHPPLPF